MKRTLIIGYGNPLRCDDGLGWHIAKLLETTIDPEWVTVLCVHQLTPELSETISQYERVILIDACMDQKPGQIQTQQIACEASPPSFSHQCAPETLLQASRDLFQAEPDMHLVTVAGDDFDYGEGLSDTVASRIPAVVDTVNELLK
jgi:hydrogenase maturation protease